MVRWARVALLSLLVGACAARPDTPPSGPSLSNRELADELVREGVGRLVTGESARAPAAGTEATAEIRETPAGVVITFRPILFVFDSARLTPTARREVERFAAVLNHPRVLARTVTLEGHADAIGSDGYNMELSRRRAASVADELIAHGVRRGRVGVEAYGARRPIAPNSHADGSDNPGGRAQNRRVEAVIHN